LRYINLDAPEQRDVLRSLPTELWHRDVGNAVVDEAQKLPEVFEKIKYAYDAGDISFQVLLGSSQIMLLKKIRETLAGRVSIYELWPLMMSELLYEADEKTPSPPLIDALCEAGSVDEVLGSVPSVLLGRDAASRKDAEQYLLRWGGMPALLGLSDNERWKWLRDYSYTYLERDLSDLARLDDLSPFRDFQKLSALRSAKLLNYSELARDCGVSVDTARRYLQYLNISYQVILLRPYYRNITSTVIKSPRIYWIDTGLLRQLTGIRDTVTGEIYETMVVGEVIKWIRTAQKDVECYFYRTRSGLEIDLILKTPAGIIAMEIKARKTIVTSDLRAMKEVAKRLGKEWVGGVVVYRGDEVKRLAEPSIWAVPSWRLFT
ncbi:MAG: ATP-binding protein, partial [Nitrospirae bacterium]